MYDIIYIFRGILIGLMVSVPLGPMGVLIIQKTLQKGALAGFVAGREELGSQTLVRSNRWQMLWV